MKYFDEFHGTGVTVDAGTKTVVLKLIDIDKSEIIDSVSFPNPLEEFGDDAISRLAYAWQKGAADVHDKFASTLNGWIMRLADRYLIERIDCALIAGSPAAMMFLLGADIKAMIEESVMPIKGESKLFKGIDLGIDVVEDVYFVGCAGAFVGSDITVEAYNLSEGEVIIDLGCNVSLAFRSNDKIYCTTASGADVDDGSISTVADLFVSGSITPFGIIDDSVAVKPLSQDKIRAVQAVRAAAATLWDKLFEAITINISEIKSVTITGEPAARLSPSELSAIGIIPKAAEDIASVKPDVLSDYATQLISKKEEREKLESSIKDFKVLEFSGRADFSNLFAENLKLGER